MNQTQNNRRRRRVNGPSCKTRYSLDPFVQTTMKNLPRTKPHKAVFRYKRWENSWRPYKWRLYRLNYLQVDQVKYVRYLNS